jgi:hypothetical protein
MPYQDTALPLSYSTINYNFHNIIYYDFNVIGGHFSTIILITNIAAGWNRTTDPLLTRQLFCQLNYYGYAHLRLEGC